MPKNDKNKVNLKERVEYNVCDLSLSELTEVPVKDIVAFKRVTVLDLSSNRLATLGKNFALLTRLVKLDLSKNEIVFLPEDFGLLRNLRHLDLYDNKLETLPLSFGQLTHLRYLDLKGNPLLPALAKIVGFCRTTKDCQDAAKDTVRFLSQMQVVVAQQQQEQKQILPVLEQTAPTAGRSVAAEVGPVEELGRARKPTKKKTKKGKSNHNNNNNNNNSNANNNNNQKPVEKAASKKPKNQKKKKSSVDGGNQRTKMNTSAVLASLFTFLLLLAINVAIIYVIMFKNPEFAERVVEFIPQQYRDWILTKTEFLRLHVTDWISEFRTQPEEH